VSYVPLLDCREGHEAEIWCKNIQGDYLYFAGCQTCGLAVASGTNKDVITIWNECIKQDLIENPKRVL